MFTHSSCRGPASPPLLINVNGGTVRTVSRRRCPKAEGDRSRGGSDPGADDLGTVAVVLEVVGGIDLWVDFGRGIDEPHVPLDPPARSQPRPRDLARRYQPLSGPYAVRT